MAMRTTARGGPVGSLAPRSLQRLSSTSRSAGLPNDGTGQTEADGEEGPTARDSSSRRRTPRSRSRSPARAPSRSRSRSGDRRTRLQGQSSGTAGGISGDEPRLPLPPRAAKAGTGAGAGGVRSPVARRIKRGAQSSSSSSSSSNSSKRDRNRRRGNQHRQKQQPELLPLFGLDIPESRVHVVDTPEHLEAAGSILGKSVVLSIDTETQPSFKMGEWHPTSLLQIATRDAVGLENILVIDLLSLKDGLLLPRSLSAILCGPFGSPDVLKLGVGLADDLNDLSFAFGKAPFLREVPGVLNLNALHALSGRELTRDDLGRPRDVGLRKLANIYLGRSLSKKQQTSRWARRPLLDAQITYAACDALVALRVFDALLETSGEIDLHELASIWTPKIYTEKGLTKEKAMRLRRRIAARATAVGQEHIRYSE